MVIQTFLAWLDLLGVSRKHVRYTVQIHESADVPGAEKFWMDLVQVGGGQMYKTNLKRHNPRTVRRNSGDDYHGCLRINVLTPPNLYWRVEGWWCGISGAAAATADVVHGRMISERSRVVQGQDG